MPENFAPLGADSRGVDVDAVAKLCSDFLNYVQPVPTDDGPVGSPQICFLSENLVLGPRLTVRASKHELSVRFRCPRVAHVYEHYHSLSSVVGEFEDWFQSPLPACYRVDDYPIETELEIGLTDRRVCLVNISEFIIDYAGNSFAC